ncbi:MAG TPA: YdeI/OmpD-associated family protein [Steroidobacteraceae bacterium]|nr:YdeI/OmpD-associated family protein [Steroidobacteraceae bacterium]
MQPRFFRAPAEFRGWLERNHQRSRELLVGFHRVGSGRASMTWPEAVDEALCFGWIDGIRRRVDDSSYTIRFTPRRPGSTWSAVNVRRTRELSARGRMAAAGLQAFEARRPDRSGRYSYEQRPAALVAPYSGMLERNARARKFFEAQVASYRRAATWWVLSAKKSDTRLARARRLIGLSARGKLIPQFVRR